MAANPIREPLGVTGILSRQERESAANGRRWFRCSLLAGLIVGTITTVAMLTCQGKPLSDNEPPPPDPHPKVYGGPKPPAKHHDLPDPISPPPPAPPKRPGLELSESAKQLILSIASQVATKRLEIVRALPAEAPTAHADNTVAAPAPFPTPSPSPAPAAQPAPAPPMPAPIVEREPSLPQIIVDAPVNRPSGKLITVRCGRSQNCRKMLVDINPPVPPDDVYQSPDGQEFVFTVPDEGTWTIKVTASSPDGGLDQVVRQVMVGSGDAPATVSRSIATPHAVNYCNEIARLCRTVKTPNAAGEAQALAGALRTVANEIQTGVITQAGQVGEQLDFQAKQTLRTFYPPWDPVTTDCGRMLGREPASLDRYQQVLIDMAMGFDRFARTGK